MNTGRTLGLLMVGAAIIVCLLGAVIAIPRIMADELTLSAGVLGMALAAIVALPLAAIGVFMITRGRQDAQTEVVAQKQRRLLDLVTSRGQIPINEAALELQTPTAEVRNWIYRLVGLGVFSGYINWDDGVLYSAQASQLREMTNCKKCGGEVKLVGKGVVKCPYCGTEYFLD